MSTHELDEHPFKPICDVNDQAILVPTDIENDPVVADKIDSFPKTVFDVLGSRPFRLVDERVPCAKGRFGLVMPCPELSQRSFSDDLHAECMRCGLSKVNKKFPIWENLGGRDDFQKPGSWFSGPENFYKYL